MGNRVERRACSVGHARVEYEVEIDENAPPGSSPVYVGAYGHGTDTGGCPICIAHDRLQSAVNELSNFRHRLEQVEEYTQQHKLWHDHAAPAVDPIIDEYYEAERARETLEKDEILEGARDVPF